MDVIPIATSNQYWYHHSLAYQKVLEQVFGYNINQIDELINQAKDEK